MAVAVNIHATCIRLERAGAAFDAPRDAGVLLLGPSGSGKSDLALRLIALGAKLVSDDRTDLFVERGKLCARAPKSLAGLIEVRSVGIVKLPRATKARIALAVQLGGKSARLPPLIRFEPPVGLGKSAPVPLIRLHAFEAAAPAKIALAVAAFAHGLFRENVNTI
jgi:hypothetical protein